MSTDYGAPALAHPEVTPALHIPCLSAPLYTNIPSLSSSQDSTKMTAFPILTWRTTIWIFRLCGGCKGSTGVHQERAISGVPIPETMKSDDNLYGRRKKRIRINSTRTDSLEIANHYSMLMISQLLLFNWNFCGIVFFCTHSLPALLRPKWVHSDPLYVHYPPTSWQLEDMESEISWVHIVFHQTNQTSASSSTGLWFMTPAALSLSAFRCRCYSPYTAICDGTLLKFHPHKY